MTISENRTASSPHRVRAVRLTDAPTGRMARTVIKPQEPESKFKTFEKSQG